MDERYPGEDQDETLEQWLVEHRELYEPSEEQEEPPKRKKNKRRRNRKNKLPKPINVGSKRRICPSCGDRNLERTIRAGMCIGCQAEDYLKSI